MADTDDLMSDAERAALADGYPDDGAAEVTTEETKSEDPKVEEPKADEPKAEPVAEVKAEPEAKAEPAPAVAAPVEPVATAPQPEPTAETDDDEPVYMTVADVEPLRAELKATEDAIEAIAVKLESGDIDAPTAFREQSKLQSKLGTLSADIRSAESARETNEALASRYAGKTLDRFMAAPDNASLYVKGSAAWNAMDAAMRTLSAMPEHNGKSYSWLVREADRVARALVDAPRSAPAPAAPAVAAKPQPSTDRTKTTPVPVTLSSLPSAAQESIESEYTYIDNLQGVEREKAIAKLTPDQYERYLSFA